MGTTERNKEKSAALPNLYALLSLQPLENDRAKIEAALRRIAGEARTNSQDAKGSQRLAKILELGKRNLLSEEHKAAYDARWKDVFRHRSPVEESAQAWDYEVLDKLLPPGDPSAPFDLSRFLEFAADLPENHIEADFQKLQSLLTGVETTPIPTAVTSGSSSVPVTPAMASASPGVVATQADSSSSARSTTGSPPPIKPTNIAQKLRKKRDQSLLLMIGGVLLSLVTVLGVLFFFVLGPGTDPKPESTVALDRNAPNQNIAGPAPTVSAPPRASGLPSVAGADAIDFGNPSGGMSGNDQASMPGEMPATAVEPEPMEPEPMEPEPMEPEPMEPEPMEPAPAPAPTEPEPAVPMQVAIPMVEPSLSDDEKAEWFKAMTEIRTAIGQQEFESAATRLAAAEALAKTTAQRSQFSRLSQLKTFAEEFYQALVKAIAGLGAGESFNVKSTPVSFVEGTAEQIILRINGTNRTYPLTELPAGLAFALVDLQLDRAHASTLVRKAAFTIVDPKINEIDAELRSDIIKQARLWMEEAITAGFVPPDMIEVFDDDYRL